MTTEFLFNFISGHRYAVLSSVSPEGKPEAALVGIATAPDLRIIFDTVTTSRKYKNLLHNHSIALVIGLESEQTIQYEGRAEILTGSDSDHLLELYFRVFPDGRERKANWQDIVYFTVKPEWIRYSDFREPGRIEETVIARKKLKSTN